jgi:hypothetical protein
MNDTDAVSCLLCLEPDEYGSMIHVCVPPGRIPPSSEKVVCRRCVAAILRAANDEPVEIAPQLELELEGLPDRAGETNVEGGETDENENYVSGEKLSKSDAGNS